MSKNVIFSIIIGILVFLTPIGKGEEIKGQILNKVDTGGSGYYFNVNNRKILVNKSDYMLYNKGEQYYYKPEIRYNIFTLVLNIIIAAVISGIAITRKK